MGWQNEKTVLYDKFSTWTATKIKYPGVPFQEPNAKYIAVNILNGEGREATVGSPAQRRHVGVVAVQIFDKENQGESGMLALADQLEPMFINANSRLTISPLEYIDFDQPSLTPAQTDGGLAAAEFSGAFYAGTSSNDAVSSNPAKC